MKKVIELKLIRHRNNNKLIFLIKYEDGTIEDLHYIKQIYPNCCYCVLKSSHLGNNYIFRILGIFDAKAYVSNIVGYTTGGN